LLLRGEHYTHSPLDGIDALKDRLRRKLAEFLGSHPNGAVIVDELHKVVPKFLDEV